MSIAIFQTLEMGLKNFPTSERPRGKPRGIGGAASKQSAQALVLIHADPACIPKGLSSREAAASPELLRQGAPSSPWQATGNPALSFLDHRPVQK